MGNIRRSTERSTKLPVYSSSTEPPHELYIYLAGRDGDDRPIWEVALRIEDIPEECDLCQVGTYELRVASTFGVSRALKEIRRL